MAQITFQGTLEELQQITPQQESTHKTKLCPACRSTMLDEVDFHHPHYDGNMTTLKATLCSSCGLHFNIRPF